MSSNVSARTKRASLVIAAALLVLALTALSLWLLHGRSDGDEVGPLEIKAGNTELVFPTPPRGTPWSATAGGFLLCSPEPDATVTLTRVAPRRGDNTGRFTSFTRAFEIRRRKAPLVGEPVIGGYGTPPWIGGIGSPHETRLVGDISSAEGATFRAPSCERSTSAPGEAAVELMLVLTADDEGASFDGVTVEYESEGRQYETGIRVRAVLCGRKVSDPDC